MGSPEDVHHHPFVYDFLGNVNIFHCRVESGKTYIGNVGLAASSLVQTDAKAAMIYVLPHLLEIVRPPEGDGYFRATVTYVNAAGPLVEVELLSEWGSPVHVELAQERYRALDLKKDDAVFVRAKDPKVFFPDYSI